jgi:hypothetical protein
MPISFARLKAPDGVARARRRVFGARPLPQVQPYRDRVIARDDLERDGRPRVLHLPRNALASVRPLTKVAYRRVLSATKLAARRHLNLALSFRDIH